MRLFWLVVVVALGFGSQTAVACGDMSVTLQLMQSWPAARGPMVAEIRERRLGRLPDPSWDVAPRGDPVAVRQRRATEVLRAVQARLVEATRPEGAASSFAVLFLDDHVWSRYELGPETARLKLKGLRPVLPQEGEARVHVSARVLDVMLAGSLDIADAEARGMLLVDGEPAAVLATRRLLHAAFTAQAG